MEKCGFELEYEGPGNYQGARRNICRYGHSYSFSNVVFKGLPGKFNVFVGHIPSLLHSFHVGEEKMAALMSRSHPLALVTGRKVRVADLVGENLIVPSRKAVIETIYKWFREVNAEPRIVCEMDSYLDAAALAGRQVGISIYPRTAYIPNDSLVFKEIAGRGKKMEYLFVWRKGHTLPVIEEHFIDFVKAMIASEQNQDN